MLLTTHAGILVNSDHVAFVVLRREEPPPSEPNPPPGTIRTFRVLLAMVGGSSVVAARNLTESEARFVREDIAHSWETAVSHFRTSESLKRLGKNEVFSTADGAYFAESSEGRSDETHPLESEVNDGTIPEIHDL